jgi:hypothetical protein
MTDTDTVRQEYRERYPQVAVAEAILTRNGLGDTIPTTGLSANDAAAIIANEAAATGLGDDESIVAFEALVSEAVELSARLADGIGNGDWSELPGVPWGDTQPMELVVAKLREIRDILDGKPVR